MAKMNIGQTQKFIQDALIKKTKEIEQRAHKEARSILWIVLKELQPVAEQKLRDIIKDRIYSRPETEFYDRTGAFLESATVKITQGGGHYKLNVYFDPEILNNVSGEGNTESKPRKFLSYAYTWGSNVGSSVDYNWLIDEMDTGIPSPAGKYTYSSITDEFLEWMDKRFEPLLHQKFEARFQKIKFDI